jgi:hypothetical protein
MANLPADKQSEHSIESWLSEHGNLFALGVVLAGLAARFWEASGTFLDADEALHFRIANQAMLALVYRASLTESHPPLLYYVLHFFGLFGASELWLRLPSVIAGTVFCWVLFQWVRCAMGKLPAFIGVIFASLLPPIVRLSAEIRHYALLLVFLASALYWLDSAFSGNSAWRMAASAACLYLAMLSHYSAVFFVAALGAYGLARILARPARLPSPLIALWVSTQLGALSLAVFLYKTHLSHLGRGEARSVLQGWMSEFYLRRSYFEAGRDNPLLFVIGHSFGIFQFIFGQLAVGDIAGLLFLAGLFLLWRRSKEAEPEVIKRRLVAFLLVVLFALPCGASLAHLYPYGGTRHTSFLIISAIAGVSIAIAHLASGRRTRAALFAFSLVALCAIFGKQHQPYMTRSNQSRARMQEAMDFLHQNVVPREIIFTDLESSMILGHYLCSQKPISVQASTAQLESFACEGYRVVSANRTTATNFTPDVFLSLVPKLAAAYRIQQNESFWVFQAGWGANFPDALRRLSEFRDLPVRAFGDNIKIFKLTPSEVSPVNIPFTPAQGTRSTAYGCPAGILRPSARTVVSSSVALPFFFVATPKLPE